MTTKPMLVLMTLTALLLAGCQGTGRSGSLLNPFLGGSTGVLME